MTEARDTSIERGKAFKAHLQKAVLRGQFDSDETMALSIAHMLLSLGFSEAAISRFIAPHAREAAKASRAAKASGKSGAPAKIGYWLVNRRDHVWASVFVQQLHFLRSHYVGQYVTGVMLRDAMLATQHIAGDLADDSGNSKQVALRILQLVEEWEEQRLSLDECKECEFRYARFLTPISYPGKEARVIEQTCPVCAAFDEAAVQSEELVEVAPAPAVADEEFPFDTLLE